MSIKSLLALILKYSFYSFKILSVTGISAATAAAAAAVTSSSSSSSASSSSASSSSSSSSSSSQLPNRIYRDGEDYPEEEIFLEEDKDKKKNKNLSVEMTQDPGDPEEIAAAQEEVTAVNIEGYLLDEEEQRKRYIKYNIHIFKKNTINQIKIINYDFFYQIKMNI